MDPQLYQASKAASPLASPRAAAPQTTPTWQPVIMDQRGSMARDGGCPEGRQSAGTAAVDAQTDAGGY
eukprot:5851947-Pyramimonas_sp.AAC.1